MIQVHQVDDAGYMIETFVVPEGTPTFSSNFIAVRCPDGFHVPRWNGSAWEEGMNIYFEYVTAASCERDGKILTTGEIMWAYKGDHHGLWTEVDAGCAVIGPFSYATASQIYLDAGEDTELYFIENEDVFIKPNADAIKQAREANRVPTTEEQIARLHYDNKVLASTNSALSDQVNGLIDYMVQSGQLV